MFKPNIFFTTELIVCSLSCSVQSYYFILYRVSLEVSFLIGCGTLLQRWLVKHLFTLPDPASSLVMNKICLSQTIKLLSEFLVMDLTACNHRKHITVVVQKINMTCRNIQDIWSLCCNQKTNSSSIQYVQALSSYHQQSFLLYFATVSEVSVSCVSNTPEHFFKRKDVMGKPIWTMESIRTYSSPGATRKPILHPWCNVESFKI